MQNQTSGKDCPKHGEFPPTRSSCPVCGWSPKEKREPAPVATIRGPRSGLVFRLRGILKKTKGHVYLWPQRLRDAIKGMGDD